MRMGSSGVSWTFFFFLFFFLFAGFSLENALNSKLCLHQDCWRGRLVQPMVNLL